MITLRKLYILVLFLFSICSMTIQAQACRDITVSLDANGYYALKETDIVHPIYTEEHITISPAEFTCDAIGTHQVRVLIYTDTDTYIHCTSTVTVEDNTPPEAKCFSSLHVILDGQGQYEFVPQSINLQSSDECSPVGILFFPPKVKCTDTSPMNVLVVARDESDNRDTCHMMVTWDPYPGPVQPIACKDSVVFKLDWDEEILLTPDMVFQDILFGCPNSYTLELFEGGNARPMPLITYGDSGALLEVTITDNGNGSQCSATIIVLTNFNCENPLPVCDVECHSAPAGDCASGHSLEDDVEWPCDITITGACPFDELYPDPDDLIWYGFADSADVFPTFGFDCLFKGYYDDIVYAPTYKIIQRHWSVLDWIAQEEYQYVQFITLEYDLTEICDTKPWTAPVINCGSGHSLSDDVEWPADITIHTPFASPEQLAKNDAVNPKSVRPELFTGCNAAEATYTDVVTEVNANTLRVQRTWVVEDIQSMQTWQYVQHITIVRDGPGSVVCVTREHGEPIPNVQLVPGVQTDVKGCHVFENPGGVVVTPVKDESLREGVNIHDQIIIREYLLGTRGLSEYQMYAADVNQDGVINDADIMAIDQILAGTFIPPFAHSWKFFEVVTNDSFADISNTLVPYYFIGVKIGDVITAEGEEILYLSAADEVLNEGETYAISFYADRDARMRGIGIRFTSPGDALAFLDVSAPQIPDFSGGHFHISPDFLSIVWIASGQYFGEGIAIRDDLPLFTLQVKANENIILHDAIALYTNFVHEFITPQQGLVYAIRLFWDAVIVSATVDLGNGRTLECYPNPVTEAMHIRGLTDQDKGMITLCNVTGQIVLQSPLQETVDMRSLQAGMYYVSVFVDGQFSKAVPVIKIQH